MIRTLFLAAAAAALLTVPTTASAFWPYGGGFGTPWGYGYTYNYGVGYIPAPPYYSVFPPVYYGSQITRRHYGASPFAWYAGMEPITYAPEAEAVAMPDPVMIENPFVPRAKSADTKSASKIETVPVAVKAYNPFVVKAVR
jgi:hypothetical protein